MERGEYASRRISPSAAKHGYYSPSHISSQHNVTRVQTPPLELTTVRTVESHYRVASCRSYPAPLPLEATSPARRGSLCTHLRQYQLGELKFGCFPAEIGVHGIYQGRGPWVSSVVQQGVKSSGRRLASGTCPRDSRLDSGLVGRSAADPMELKEQAEF